MLTNRINLASAAKRGAKRLAGPPLRWFTRMRIVVLGHEDLTSILLWAALIGICGALASVAFREAIRAFEWLMTGHTGGLVAVATDLPALWRVLVPMLGGVAAGLVLQYGAAWVSARRNVDYMEAVAVGDGVIAARPTLVRSLSSLLTIGSGGSIGREGPMVQLAALIGSKLGLLTRAPGPRRRLFVACGAAAGIASAYNAPIAGAVFVAEIVMGSFAMESFGPLLVAAVAADATIHRLLGYGPVFQVPAVQFGENWELILYAVMGVLLGHLAPPFLALLDWTRERFAAPKLPIFLRFALGGLVVGMISLKFPQVWGNGYSVVDAILHDRLMGSLLVAVLLAKVASTASTVGSGAVGGVFTPTLFIGAAVGALLGAAMHMVWPHMTSGSGAFAIVGMGGFLAAMTHAPLTSVLMIFEMTLDHQVVLPLILACVTAHYVAKVYRGGASVYRDALQVGAVGSSDAQWRLRTVAGLIKPASAVVNQAQNIHVALNELPRRAVRVVYVVSNDRELLGVVEPRTLLLRLKRKEIEGTATVLSVASQANATLTADMSLTAALEVFLREQVSALPVISGSWRATLLGEISRHDLLLALQDRLAGNHLA